MTLRLTPEETEALRETARREHRSMQAVAREAIAAYVSSRTRSRDEHLADAIGFHHAFHPSKNAISAFWTWRRFSA